MPAEGDTRLRLLRTLQRATLEGIGAWSGVGVLLVSIIFSIALGALGMRVVMVLDGYDARVAQLEKMTAVLQYDVLTLKAESKTCPAPDA